MLIKTIATATTLFIILVSMGCNRSVNRSTIVQETLFHSSAPDWAQGQIPREDGRIFFVGRSEMPNYFANRISRFSRANTYNNAYATWWTSEREAVSSARDDVYDQIRQRLAPRNVGNASNLVVGNIESGTCTNCGNTNTNLANRHHSMQRYLFTFG